MNKKIVSVSRVLGIVVLTLIVAIPLVVAFLWLIGSEDTLLSRIPQYWFIPDGILFQAGLLAPTLRVTGLLISITAIIPLQLALWQLRCLFLLFTKRIVFELETASRMKKFAGYVVAFAFLQPIIGGVLSVVTSIDNEPGHRVLSITFAGTDITTILLGVTVFVVAYIMEEACKLADENEKFV